MAGIKISALPVSGAAQLTDIVPVVQTGVTSQQTWSTVISLFNANVQLSSTAQVTGLPAALASFVPLAGGTMTGPLILSGVPTVGSQAANKTYVDTVASGFTVILAAAAATTANLNATPAGAGIGATLTNAGAMAAFAVDGYNANTNDRILVKNQTLSQQNGVYTVTTVGSGAVNWVLTRATDYDTAAQIKPGTLVAVNNGTANANTSWLETATVVTVDTDPILFSQFTFAPSAFLMVANNLSDVANAATSRTNLGLTSAATMSLPVSGTNGGTGVNNGASTITIGGNIAFSGAFTFTGTLTANTAITFPTSGTLLTSAQPTINQPNIVGVTTNSNAASGSVGEFISSVVNFAGRLSLVNNTPRDVTSISLTAGDWNVWGNTTFVTGGSVTNTSGWINTSSATQPDQSLIAQAFVSGAWSVPQQRISVNGTTTVYLSGQATFGAGGCSICGGIYARRIR